MSKQRNSNFSSDEVNTLIGVWTSHQMQDKFLSRNLRHSVIYEEISKLMQDMGYQRSAQVLRKKIANLKALYYFEKRKTLSNSSPSTWPFWSSMHMFLGSQPIASPKNESKYHVGNMMMDSDITSNDTDDPSLRNSFEVDLGDISPASVCQVSMNTSSSSQIEEDSETVPLRNNFTKAQKRRAVTRRLKHPLDYNALLRQLASNDKRRLALAERQLKLEEDSKKINDDMAAAATRFFNSYAALAEQALNAIPSEGTHSPVLPAFLPFPFFLPGCKSSDLVQPSLMSRMPLLGSLLSQNQYDCTPEKRMND